MTRTVFDLWCVLQNYIHYIIYTLNQRSQKKFAMAEMYILTISRDSDDAKDSSEF